VLPPASADEEPPEPLPPEPVRMISPPAPVLPPVPIKSPNPPVPTPLPPFPVPDPPEPVLFRSGALHPNEAATEIALSKKSERNRG
jgi:hypothetical protein